MAIARRDSCQNGFCTSLSTSERAQHHAQSYDFQNRRRRKPATLMPSADIIARSVPGRIAFGLVFR